MDTVKVFDALDKRVERLVARLKSLELENEKLKADLSASRKAEREAGGSKGVVEKLEREQDLVRERLEKLIHALEAADEARKP